MSDITDAFIYFADIELAKLVVQPGGKQREDAIADAQQRVETLRGESIAGIESALRETEMVLNVAQDMTLDKDQLLRVRELADRVITLAGAFGYEQLSHVARSLGDLTNMLLILGTAPADPIIVHIRSAWMFAPRAAIVPAENAHRILAELRRVLDHFGLLAGSEEAPSTEEWPSSPGPLSN
ncbi:MAG: hypothetical protein WAW96_09390 [Alphaproteobacteria bacterium]